MVSCAHSAVQPCRSWNPGQAPGPTGVCVPAGALLSESHEPSAGLDAAQRQLLQLSGGQCPGRGCRAGAGPAEAASWPAGGGPLPCWQPEPSWRVSAFTSVKPTRLPAPSSRCVRWFGDDKHGGCRCCRCARNSRPGGDCGGRSRQPVPPPRPWHPVPPGGVATQTLRRDQRQTPPV